MEWSTWFWTLSIIIYIKNIEFYWSRFQHIKVWLAPPNVQYHLHHHHHCVTHLLAPHPRVVLSPQSAPVCFPVSADFCVWNFFLLENWFDAVFLFLFSPVTGFRATPFFSCDCVLGCSFFFCDWVLSHFSFLLWLGFEPLSFSCDLVLGYSSFLLWLGFGLPFSLIL